jgi:ribosome-binding protein aMBF1 (putative translation factor)
MAHRKRAAAGTLTVAGVEYVVIPKAEYLRLLDKQVPMGAVDAREFVRQSLGVDLRAAREAAGLTQAELARRMSKSQTLISQAESGTARVSERYVRAVLAACGLPADWSGPNAKVRRSARKKSATR